MELESNISDSEESLFNNERFISLEEIAEEELPFIFDEMNKDTDKERLYNHIENYFKEIYSSNRDVDIAKIFYGIKSNRRGAPDLAKEYSLSKQRVMEIVNKPLCRVLKQITLRVLDGESFPCFYEIYGRKKRNDCSKTI